MSVGVCAILSYAAPLPGDPRAGAALHQPGRAAGRLCGGGASRGGPGHRGEELPACTAHLEPAATGKPPSALTYKVKAVRETKSCNLRVLQKCLNE